MIRFFLVLIAFASGNAWSQSSIEVKTKYDSYMIVKSNKGWTIGTAPVRDEALKPLLEVARQEINSPCADMVSKPEVSLKVNNTGGASDARTMDISKGVLKSSKGCVLISGPGLNEFPMHRGWLIGPVRGNIALNKNFNIAYNPGPNVGLVEEKDDWKNTDPSYEFNWDFFEKFKNSLKDFNIGNRYSLASAKGKRSVSISSNGVQHTFVQMAPNVWGKVNEKIGAIETSPNWSIWGDMGVSQWADPNTENIRFFKNTSHPAADRKSKAEAMGGTWNPNIREMLSQCLLNAEEDSDLRMYCADRLRRKPTQETFQVFIKLINGTEDDELLKKAESTLRIKNPKGTRYSGPSSLNTFRNSWNTWWQSTNGPTRKTR